METVNVKYLFFRGPYDLSEEFGDIIHRSKLRDEHPIEEYSIIYNDIEIPVLLHKYQGRYFVWAISNHQPPQEVNERINLPASDPLYLPIYVTTRIVDTPWVPLDKLYEENEWLSIMIDVDTNTIIGEYHGEIYTDNLNRIYSTHSFINIRPDYRGKRLCTAFSSFAYDQVVKIMDVDYISITIGSKTPLNACRCYVQAALNIGLIVYNYDVKNNRTNRINRESCVDTTSSLIFIVPRSGKHNRPDKEMLRSSIL